MLPFRVLDFGRVRVRVQVAPLTVESFREQLASEAQSIRTQVATRKHELVEKAVVVNHPSVELVPPHAAIRQMQAQWLKENEDLLRLTCLGMGFVVPNTIVRGVVTAVFWLAPLPLPCTTHPSIEAAIDWAIAEVERSGGSPPAPELMRFRSSAVERALRVA